MPDGQRDFTALFRVKRDRDEGPAIQDLYDALDELTVALDEARSNVLMARQLLRHGYKESKSIETQGLEVITEIANDLQWIAEEIKTHVREGRV